jgi:hypothetical protein
MTTISPSRLLWFVRVAPAFLPASDGYDADLSAAIPSGHAEN